MPARTATRELLGADVPGGDEPLRIQRDESMFGKTLDSETKNVLGDDGLGLFSRPSAKVRLQSGAEPADELSRFNAWCSRFSRRATPIES